MAVLKLLDKTSCCLLASYNILSKWSEYIMKKRHLVDWTWCSGMVRHNCYLFLYNMIEAKQSAIKSNLQVHSEFEAHLEHTDTTVQKKKRQRNILIKHGICLLYELITVLHILHEQI